MTPMFLQIVQDSSDPSTWVISPMVQMSKGYEFIIVCSSKEEADKTVAKMRSGELNYPTVDAKGFDENVEKHPILQSVRVYKPYNKN